MTPPSNRHQEVRLIANYLPQFHPIPENDRFWGPGFTEWTNVAKAKPLFPGHYQPHIPADLGFYDLRVPEVREQQAELAWGAGIEAFCYWHYWFGGGLRLLDRPLREVVQSGRPGFSFCVGWANESWSGIWHGAADRTLIEQAYPGRKDEKDHFRYLLPMFHDERYLRVDGKPLFLVLRATQIPEVRRFTDHWRELAVQSGLPGLHLVAYEKDDWPAEQYGFDAATWAHQSTMKWVYRNDHRRVADRAARGLPIHVYDYEEAIPWMHGPKFPNFPVGDHHYPSIVCGWDNSPRSGAAATILHGYHPELFRQHVRHVLCRVLHKPWQHRVVFAKSWNEWAEGNYLEPEVRYGRAFLEILLEELTALRNPQPVKLNSCTSPEIHLSTPVQQPQPTDRRQFSSISRRDPGGFLRGYERDFQILKDRLIPPLVELAYRTGSVKESLFLMRDLDLLDERLIEYPLVAAQIFAERQRVGRPLRLLDVGCVLNNSFISDAVRDACEMIWLMNPIIEKPTYRDRVGYLVGDARHFHLPDELRFDLITCLSTLEHFGMDNTRYGGRGAEFEGIIDDPEKYACQGIESIASWVKPGGALLASVPYGPFEFLYVSGQPGKPIYYTFDQARLEKLSTSLAGKGFAVSVDVFKVIPDAGWIRTEMSDPDILRHAEHCAAAGAVAFLLGRKI